ncbi:MAG: hypothetical protein MZV49_13660 [Rhodopseudomonas palustris]|nr:hypothetical protein [Rhodopseudomonas palustris]
MLDLKNQLQELKTTQLQAQNQALIQQSGQLNEIMRTVNETLSKGQGNITSQLGQTGAVVGEIQQKLGAAGGIDQPDEGHRQGHLLAAGHPARAQAARQPGRVPARRTCCARCCPPATVPCSTLFPDGAQGRRRSSPSGERLIPVDAKFLAGKLRAPLRGRRRRGPEESTGKEFVKQLEAAHRRDRRQVHPPRRGHLRLRPDLHPGRERLLRGDDQRRPGRPQLRHLQLRRGEARHPRLAQQLLRLPDGHRLRPQGADASSSAPSRSSRTWSRCRRASASSTPTSCLLGKHLGNAGGKFDETAKKAEKFKDRLADFTGVRGELQVPGDKP